MKRTISIFLSLVMALSLCACGGKSNETELTLDNYSTYLTVSASVSDPGLEDPLVFTLIITVMESPMMAEALFTFTIT